jgi:hypothetical protein
MSNGRGFASLASITVWLATPVAFSVTPESPPSRMGW